VLEVELRHARGRAEGPRQGGGGRVEEDWPRQRAALEGRAEGWPEGGAEFTMGVEQRGRAG
jgi:hypothetical protein